MTISGACHCEQIKWIYENRIDGLTSCNCTLCRRYGALWAYGYLDEGIFVSGQTKAYRRGSKINGFHFCENCGCLAYYMSDSKNDNGQLRIAVNMRMANDPKEIESFPIDHFDGLDKFEDLPRDHRLVKDVWF